MMRQFLPGKWVNGLGSHPYGIAGLAELSRIRAVAFWLVVAVLIVLFAGRGLLMMSFLLFIALTVLEMKLGGEYENLLS